MKRQLFILSSIVFLLAACNNEKKEEKKANESTDAKEESNEKVWIPVDSATSMKVWMEYAAVGDPHKMLAKSSGNWAGENTMWMADGAPPVKTTSMSSSKMVMDGRYQVTDFSGDFMGQPFTGMSIMGYDNYKKTFFSTWIDNMGTGILLMEGPWDEATKSFTLTGKYKNPGNGLDCEMKEVYKIIDDNNHVMEMYGPDQLTGKQYKTMEIKFTRKK